MYFSFKIIIFLLSVVSIKIENLFEFSGNYGGRKSKNNLFLLRDCFKKKLFFWCRFEFTTLLYNLV